MCPAEHQSSFFFLTIEEVLAHIKSRYQSVPHTDPKHTTFDLTPGTYYYRKISPSMTFFFFFFAVVGVELKVLLLLGSHYTM
jgi:hypothetical protein